MHPEQFRFDKIQNGSLLAIIDFHMSDIWYTVSLAGLILLNKMWGFGGRMHPEIFQLNLIKNDRQSAIIYLDRLEPS